MRFFPLQRMRKREPTRPGFASSRFRCGFRVSHPLAAFRLPRPSDLFRTVTLLGFSPSKLFPPAEPRRLSAPLALLPLPATGFRDSKATSGRKADATSGLCSPRRSVTAERGLADRPLDAPLGFRALGHSFRRVARGFPPAPLSGFSAPPLTRRHRRPPRVSIRIVVLAPPLRPHDRLGAATLLRFSHLVFASAGFEPNRPGLTPTVPVALLPRTSVYGASSTLPEGQRRKCRCQAPGRHPTLDAQYIRAVPEPSSYCGEKSYVVDRRPTQLVPNERLDKSDLTAWKT